MNEEKQPAPESADEKLPVENLTPSTPETEKEIDLNTMFPNEESDLNALFPDEEIKHLLKTITRNKKDLHAIKGRLAEEESWGDDPEEEPKEDQEQPLEEPESI